MAKKPALRRSAESIWSKPLSKGQKTVLDRIARRQARGDEASIDYSDMPALTGRRLAEFKPLRAVMVRQQGGRD